MLIESTDRSLRIEWIVVSSILAILSVVAYFKIGSGYSFIGMGLALLPILAIYLNNKIHLDNNVIITDDEVVCTKCACDRESDWIIDNNYYDRLTIKRADIEKTEMHFQRVGSRFQRSSHSHYNLVMYTKKGTYIIDGRLADTDAVNFELGDKKAEAIAKFDRSQRKKRSGSVFGSLIYFLLSAVLVSDLVSSDIEPDISDSYAVIIENHTNHNVVVYTTFDNGGETTIATLQPYSKCLLEGQEFYDFCKPKAVLGLGDTVYFMFDDSLTVKHYMKSESEYVPRAKNIMSFGSWNLIKTKNKYKNKSKASFIIDDTCLPILETRTE